MATTLITGAAGFIGFHTASKLLERGENVAGIDNLNEYYDPKLKQARLDVLTRQPTFNSCVLMSPTPSGWRVSSRNIASPK